MCPKYSVSRKMKVLSMSKPQAIISFAFSTPHFENYSRDASPFSPLL